MFAPCHSSDHPIPVAVIGSIGGILSVVLTWLSERMETIHTALAIATQLVGLGVALLTFLILLRRWRYTPREPQDVDDDVPFR